MYKPVIEALGQGHSVLVHCVNGRHRSAQVAAAILRGFLPSADAAMNEVAILRQGSEILPNALQILKQDSDGRRLRIRGVSRTRRPPLLCRTYRKAACFRVCKTACAQGTRPPSTAFPKRLRQTLSHAARSRCGRTATSLSSRHSKATCLLRGTSRSIAPPSPSLRRQSCVCSLLALRARQRPMCFWGSHPPMHVRRGPATET